MPISRVRSRTATSITFITPMPPTKQRGDAHRAQEVLHAVGHRAGRPCASSTVSQIAGRLLVAGDRSRAGARARAAPRPCTPRGAATERGLRPAAGPPSRPGRAGLLGKSRRIVLEGDEHLGDVAPVVAESCSLCAMTPTIVYGKSPMRMVSPRAGRLAEELLLRVAAEERHAPAGGLVAPSRDSAPRPRRCCGCRRTAAATRSRAGPRCCRRCAPGRCPGRARASRTRRTGTRRAIRSWSVAVHWTRRPARSPPACRLVRPAKMISMSLPNSACHLGLAHAQPLARRHHEGDRDDAPGDAEHGEGGAQLVRAQACASVSRTGP